jgi:hypothetical protein
LDIGGVIMEIKDFMGNILEIGDKIVVTDKTYSKTPLLKVGIITEIKHEKTQSGQWKETVIYFKVLGISDKYFCQLEYDNYKQDIDDEEEGVFYINKNKYVSILKIC